MKLDTHEQLVRDALDVVRQYDPATYWAMDASQWLVVTEPGRLLASMHGIGFDDMLATTQSYSRAMGITLNRREFASVPLSALNMTTLRKEADLNGAPVAWQVAVVLVHEWAHTGQPEDMPRSEREREAYTRGADFARRLPEPYGEKLASGQETVRDSMMFMLLLEEALAA